MSTQSRGWKRLQGRPWTRRCADGCLPFDTQITDPPTVVNAYAVMDAVWSMWFAVGLIICDGRTWSIQRYACPSISHRSGCRSLSLSLSVCVCVCVAFSFCLAGVPRYVFNVMACSHTNAEPDPGTRVDSAIWCLPRGCQVWSIGLVSIARLRCQEGRYLMSV